MVTRVRSNYIALWFACLALPSVTTAAQAQSARVEKKIDRLEKQVKALQRQVFQGDTVYFNSNSGSEEGAVQPQTAAAQIVRLDDLEQKVRLLTGQMEQMRFEQREMKDRLDTFMAQVSYRLNALDGAGQPEQGAGAEQSEAATDLDAEEGAARRDFKKTFQAPSGPVPVPEPVGPERPAVADAAVAAQPDGANEQPVSLPVDPKEQFNEAFALARRDRFDDAEQAFLMFLADHPEHELASNAQYWLGRVYTAKQEKSRAAEAFFEGYRRYPNGNKAPENLLAFASTLRQMDKPKEACTALTLLRSKVADDAYPNLSDRVRQGIDSESAVLGCQ